MTVDLGALASIVMSHAPDSAERAEELTRAALRQGTAPERIIAEGLIAGMSDVGRRFRAGEIFVPEVLVSARAMHAALAVLEPVLIQCGHEPLGKCVLGTVQGDIHDIGKNLVGMLLEGAGLEVVDLGVNTSLRKFNEAIETHEPELVGMSALLTTTMPWMQKNIRDWEQQGWRGRFHVIVGGAPVSESWAAEIGADGYGADAASAVDVALGLLRRSPR